MIYLEFFKDKRVTLMGLGRLGNPRFSHRDTPRAGMRVGYPNPSSAGKQHVFPTPFWTKPPTS